MMVLDRKRSTCFNHINNLQKKLKATHNQGFAVGLFEEQGEHSSGYSYAALGQYLSDGDVANNMVARPFLDVTYAFNGRRYQTMFKKAYGQWLLSNKQSGDIKTFIQKFARMQVKDVQNIFGSTTYFASNAPLTQALKGKNSPLLDTGELRDQIAFKLSWSGSVQY